MKLFDQSILPPVIRTDDTSRWTGYASQGRPSSCKH